MRAARSIKKNSSRKNETWKVENETLVICAIQTKGIASTGRMLLLDKLTAWYDKVPQYKQARFQSMNQL